VPDIDAILVAVGGGGLIGGILAAVKTLRPDIQIIGVEPEVLPSMKTALQNSGVIEIPAAQTLADGIAVRRVGRIPFEQIQHQIDDMVTVTEAEIARAVLVLLEQEKTLAEGAGAASLAALLAGKVHLPGKRVCALICGGNIDVNVISRIIERGLVATGRLCRLSLRVTDTPGALAHVLTIVGRLKANVLEIHHNRTFTSGEQFGTTHVELKLETRGDDHVEAIRRALNDDEFTIIEHL
jgi:threonine dehydratase